VYEPKRVGSLSENSGKLFVLNYAPNLPTSPTTVDLPSVYSGINNYYSMLSKVRCCQQKSGNNRLPNLLKVNFFEYGSFGGARAVARQVNNDISGDQQLPLYCFHQGKENNGELWFTTFDGSTWTRDQQVPRTGMSAAPSIVVRGYPN
jgi:hypothetical protein